MLVFRPSVCPCFRPTKKCDTQFWKKLSMLPLYNLYNIYQHGMEIMHIFISIFVVNCSTGVIFSDSHSEFNNFVTTISQKALKGSFWNLICIFRVGSDPKTKWPSGGHFEFWKPNPILLYKTYWLSVVKMSPPMTIKLNTSWDIMKIYRNSG